MKTITTNSGKEISLGNAGRYAYEGGSSKPGATWFVRTYDPKSNTYPEVTGPFTYEEAVAVAERIARIDNARHEWNTAKEVPF